MQTCGICKEIVNDLKCFEDYVGNPSVPIFKIILQCARESSCKYVENGVCYSCVEDLVNYHEAVLVAKHFKHKLLDLIEKIPVAPAKTAVFKDIVETNENNTNRNEINEINSDQNDDSSGINDCDGEQMFQDNPSDDNQRNFDNNTFIYDDDTEDEKDEVVSSNVCHECGEVFADRLSCKLHIEKRHVIKYVCELCGKALKSKHSLQMHKIGHKPEKPFSCKICTKQFHFKDRLDDHIAKHSGVKPFKCKICEKHYPHKKSLNSHMMIHRKSRLKHKCNVCNRIFRNPSLLKYHEMIHSSVKSHFCKYCNRGFLVKYYLTQHLKDNKKCYQAFTADYNANNE